LAGGKAGGLQPSRDGNLHLDRVAAGLEARERHRSTRSRIRMDSAAISRPRASLALSGKLRAWLVLGRVSNLPAVWSNCLAGCWLGGWNTPGALLLLCLGGTLLHAGGMFLNDACDVDFDAEFRPERPIVSGALNRRAVIIAAAALFAVGVVLIATINGRSGMFAVGLTMLIVVYNWM